MKVKEYAWTFRTFYSTYDPAVDAGCDDPALVYFPVGETVDVGVSVICCFKYTLMNVHVTKTCTCLIILFLQGYWNGFMHVERFNRSHLSDICGTAGTLPKNERKLYEHDCWKIFKPDPLQKVAPAPGA